MDLSPLYELRDRLRAGAIAGAALAADDFRLKRALETLAPLEGAAPVFARLGQLTRALLDPGCPDRAGALLDALTLADAVLCTQGAVAVPGEVEPLPLARRGSAVTNAPYSVLAPLLEALTTTGSGKYSFVLDTHSERPELFRDYRVKDAMVTALGASYSELADQVEGWLSGEDESILPLLERGFDPRGKKDMVRRVRVMESVAGADANEFYLAQLEHAEKEVRAALIYALRHTEENADKLADLCKTEKGACKKMAHWALAKLTAPAAWDYWNKLAVKKPDQAVEYMALSTTDQASSLVAGALGRWLEPYETDPDRPLGPKEMEQLQALLSALPGKAGPEICDCYRRMAALGTALDEKSYQGTNGQNMAVRFQRLTPLCTSRDLMSFSQAVPHVLRQSILFRPAPDLLELAEELEQTCETSFAVPILTAALLSRPAGEVFDVAEPFLRPAGLFHKKERKAGRNVLKAALNGLHWDEEGRGLVYSLTLTDPATERSVRLVRPILQRPDRRWYDALMGIGAEDGMDALLNLLLCPDEPDLCAVVGKYFYQRALFVDNSPLYLPWLRRCGWTKCQGLLEAYCKRHRVSSRDVHWFVYQMPGTPEDVSTETRRVLQLVQEKKIAVGTSWYPAQIEQALLNLQNTAPNELTGGNT